MEAIEAFVVETPLAPPTVSPTRPNRWRLTRWFEKDRRSSLLAALAGLVCLLAFSYFNWVNFGPASWGPRFWCAHTSVDVGDVIQGQVVRRDFLIKNTGRQDLYLTEITPGCPFCLRLATSTNKLGPGETATIRVLMLTAKLAPVAPQAVFNFKKTVHVHTNDPNRPHVLLHLSGVLHPEDASARRDSSPQHNGLIAGFDTLWRAVSRWLTAARSSHSGGQYA